MEVRKKNYKETLSVLLDLGENYDGEDFAIRFQTGKFGANEYWCRKVGTKLTGCDMADDGRHVLCVLPGADAEGLGGHGLSAGVLNAETWVWLPTDVAGVSEWTLVSRGEVVCTEVSTTEDEDGEEVSTTTQYKIMLWAGVSDTTGVSVGAWEIVGPVMKGEKGDTGGSFPDAPATGGPWARQGGAWVPAGNDLGLSVVNGQICITYSE